MRYIRAFCGIAMLALSGGGAMAEPATSQDTFSVHTDGAEIPIQMNPSPALSKPDPCAGYAVTSSRGGVWCIIAVGAGVLRSVTSANTDPGAAVDHVVAVGRCAGASLVHGRNAILIGDYTSAPEGSDGFVNIDNHLCFWRKTGERVTCPPPEPECEGKE